MNGHTVYIIDGLRIGHLFLYVTCFCLQEELAEGLHLIDFEQLKIENQTYNEKIEERNEVRKYQEKSSNPVV